MYLHVCDAALARAEKHPAMKVRLLSLLFVHTLETCVTANEKRKEKPSEREKMR